MEEAAVVEVGVGVEVVMAAEVVEDMVEEDMEAEVDMVEEEVMVVVVVETGGSTSSSPAHALFSLFPVPSCL